MVDSHDASSAGGLSGSIGPGLQVAAGAASSAVDDPRQFLIDAAGEAEVNLDRARGELRRGLAKHVKEQLKQEEADSSELIGAVLWILGKYEDSMSGEGSTGPG